VSEASCNTGVRSFFGFLLRVRFLHVLSAIRQLFAGVAEGSVFRLLQKDRLVVDPSHDHALRTWRRIAGGEQLDTVQIIANKSHAALVGAAGNRSVVEIEDRVTIFQTSVVEIRARGCVNADLRTPWVSNELLLGGFLLGFRLASCVRALRFFRAIVGFPGRIFESSVQRLSHRYGLLVYLLQYQDFLELLFFGFRVFRIECFSSIVPTRFFSTSIRDPLTGPRAPIDVNGAS
jgi:hypothetical protein